MSFSDRLRQVLKTFNVSQTELAKRINVKPQIIQYLCASNTHKSKFAFDIAEALAIDVIWLMTGKGSFPEPEKLSTRQRQIPLLSFSEIREYKVHGKRLKTTAIKNWLPISEDLHLDCYGVMLNDRSMAPRFDLDAIIIIDPEAQIKNENQTYVLTYIKEQDFILFRGLEKNGKKKVLKPTNHKLYKDLEMTSEDKILGICKEVRWNY